MRNAGWKKHKLESRLPAEIQEKQEVLGKWYQRERRESESDLRL